jgi:YHS domain-containing protein/thiol-disulfide isomerase/thioredoxin
MTPSRPRLTRVAVAAGLALGGILGGMTPSHALGATPIEWRGDLTAARAEAIALDRLVWVQFTAPWCHNCHRIEGEAFVHPRVLHLASVDFIPVKLRSDAHEELALGYGLSSLPACVILRPGGEVVAKVQGYLDPETFLSFLHESLAREGRSPRRLALEGYCPVSLVDDHRLEAGRPALTIDRDGEVYRFATSAGREAFRQNPARYVPANGGRCAVAQVDRGEVRAGSPNWGLLYDGHLYLCADMAERARFLKTPERYAHVNRAERESCPHCWAVEAWLVRTRPADSLARRRRDLFPDQPHLETSRRETESTRR